ncbi:MAG: STAS domain-containing protein [Rikenellaceae bacterium]
MNVEVTKQEDGTVTLNVEGRVDTVTAKNFETSAMAALKDNPTQIVMDCSELSYVSSSGLRVFLMMQKGVNAAGIKMRIINMSDSIKQVFKITGFASILTIE